VGASGSATGIDVAALDGELATLGATLNDAFERLRAAVVREERFAADVAHELRTPLATLRSRAELALSRERDGGDYRVALQDVLAASRAMQGTVDDLLLLAGTEAGGFQAERFDLREAVLRAADGALPAARASGRRILVELGDRPAVVHGSPALLERLAANLLENALRHGRAQPPADAVEVEVRPGERAATLLVRDRGPGFPATLLPRLFERFTRGDPSRTRETGGSGLGLSICRAIVAAHGGTIRAQGRDGGGAEISVTLPTD
jgi:signal transduction histidine kinase